MFNTDIVTLLSESAHGVFDSVTPTERTVFCLVKSVTMRETYEAMARDLNPSVVFVLADSQEYQNEKSCKYNGVIYDIIRTYVTGRGIELTAQRRV